MKCCGEQRDTQFCPTCGKPLLGDPLVTLLQFCQVHRKQCDRWVAAVAEDVSTYSPRNVDKGERHLARVSRTRTKWTRWIAALEQAIANNERSPKPEQSRAPGGVINEEKTNGA